MNTFEEELYNMFGNTDIIEKPKISGSTLLGSLGNGNLAKIFFVDTCVLDHYDALRVKIISRMDGEIDAQTFKFGDIVGKVNRFGFAALSPYIWDDGHKIYWYVPVEEYQKHKIAKTILDYISMYRED